MAVPVPVHVPVTIKGAEAQVVPSRFFTATVDCDCDYDCDYDCGCGCNRRFLAANNLEDPAEVERAILAQFRIHPSITILMGFRVRHLVREIVLAEVAGFPGEAVMVGTRPRISGGPQRPSVRPSVLPTGRR